MYVLIIMLTKLKYLTVSQVNWQKVDKDSIENDLKAEDKEKDL